MNDGGTMKPLLHNRILLLGLALSILLHGILLVIVPEGAFLSGKTQEIPPCLEPGEPKSLRHPVVLKMWRLHGPAPCLTVLNRFFLLKTGWQSLMPPCQQTHCLEQPHRLPMMPLLLVLSIDGHGGQNAAPYLAGFPVSYLTGKRLQAR